ncbi:unnamed protein product [Blepharisma stoltei]|uniref:histidine kinase n=1 Tax=Blepharisma stoltei TaxID=1481888 RepID=A0AAU9JSR0_9CILI|nr:unnamed protein product [Blepharisma stoltei]
MMPKELLEEWWDEEISQKFSILHFFVRRNIAICMLIIPIFAIYDLNSLSLWLQILIVMLFQAISCILADYINTNDTSKKALFAVFYSEFCCFGLFYLSYNQMRAHAALFEMFCAILMMSFEIPLIRCSWIKYIVAIKHVFIWHYIGYFRDSIAYDGNMIPLFFAVICVFMYNYMTNMRSKSSIERFLNRKGKSKAKMRLSVIVNAFPDGIFIISDNLEIMYTNDNLLKLLDCESEELIRIISEITYCDGKKYSTLSNSNLLIEDLQAIFRQNDRNEFMLGISYFKGNNIEWKGLKIIWENKQALAIIVRDANHIIQLERSISDSKVKTVILRSVSHELRTPINAISFLVEDLLEKQNDNIKEDWKEKLKIISISTKLLLTLVNDLLDYSRMLSGAFSIRKCECDLRNIIENAWELIKLQALKKNIDLILRIDPTLPVYIYSDPLRLSQVLLNLLSNALKFTLCGSIEVICISTMSNQLKITVRDTGIGIDENQKNKLFQEFCSEVLPILNPNGCGLGLHISNKIVKELGGNIIEVESKIGHGSAFSFNINMFHNSLPYEIASNDYDDLLMSEMPNLEIALSKCLIINKINLPQILIADDNDFNRLILISLLLKNGIPALEACTGKQAVDIILKHNVKEHTSIKVIIMDVEMPQMNGWVAAQKIHDMHSKEEIRFLPNIIGYTAYNTDEDISNCYKSGMKECLIKPCSSEKIISTILKYS